MKKYYIFTNFLVAATYNFFVCFGIRQNYHATLGKNRK